MPRRWRVLCFSMRTVHPKGRAVDCLLGRCTVADAEGFLASMLPRLTAADTALHDGDAGSRKALWSTPESGGRPGTGP